ncbi:MAG: hypothetical protein LBT67_02500 [Holosporaceae bacterium]|jgi:hypothetical protein|nr:hypothetical protein [Holosporaceae bacterium]
MKKSIFFVPALLFCIPGFVLGMKNHKDPLLSGIVHKKSVNDELVSASNKLYELIREDEEYSGIRLVSTTGEYGYIMHAKYENEEDVKARFELLRNIILAANKLKPLIDEAKKTMDDEDDTFNNEINIAEAYFEYATGEYGSTIEWLLKECVEAAYRLKFGVLYDFHKKFYQDMEYDCMTSEVADKRLMREGVVDYLDIARCLPNIVPVYQGDHMTSKTADEKLKTLFEEVPAYFKIAEVWPDAVSEYLANADAAAAVTCNDVKVLYEEMREVAINRVRERCIGCLKDAFMFAGHSGTKMIGDLITDGVSEGNSPFGEDVLCLADVDDYTTVAADDEEPGGNKIHLIVAKTKMEKFDNANKKITRFRGNFSNLGLQLCQLSGKFWIDRYEWRKDEFVAAKMQEWIKTINKVTQKSKRLCSAIEYASKSKVDRLKERTVAEETYKTLYNTHVMPVVSQLQKLTDINSGDNNGLLRYFDRKKDLNNAKYDYYYYYKVKSTADPVDVKNCLVAILEYLPRLENAIAALDFDGIVDEAEKAVHHKGGDVVGLGIANNWKLANSLHTNIYNSSNRGLVDKLIVGYVTNTFVNDAVISNIVNPQYSIDAMYYGYNDENSSIELVEKLERAQEDSGYISATYYFNKTREIAGAVFNNKRVWDYFKVVINTVYSRVFAIPSTLGYASCAKSLEDLIENIVNAANSYIGDYAGALFKVESIDFCVVDDECAKVNRNQMTITAAEDALSRANKGLAMVEKLESSLYKKYDYRAVDNATLAFVEANVDANSPGIVGNNLCHFDSMSGCWDRYQRAQQTVEDRIMWLEIAIEIYKKYKNQA